MASTYDPVEARIDTPFGRAYVVGGRLFPSVTTVLAATAYKPGLAEWRQRVGEAEAERIRREAAERGTRLHAMMEDYLATGAEGHGAWWASIRQVLPRLRATTLAEAPVAKRGELGYVGTVDHVGIWAPPVVTRASRARLTVTDWKSANREKPRAWVEDYEIQIAAYADTDEVRELGPEAGLVAIAVPNEKPTLIEMDRKRLEIRKAQLERKLIEFYRFAWPVVLEAVEGLAA